MFKNRLKHFPFPAHCKSTIFTPHISLWGLWRYLWVCSVGDFLCLGLLVANLLIRLHDVVVWEYKTFNTKYLIINSDLTASCSCNRSAGDKHTYVHTHTNSCVLKCVVKIADTRILTLIPTLDLACTNTYILGCSSLKHFQELLHYTHT